VEEKQKKLSKKKGKLASESIKYKKKLYNQWFLWGEPVQKKTFWG
jgi:hypothetical protein